MAGVIFQLPLARLDFVKIWEPKVEKKIDPKTGKEKETKKYGLVCIWDKEEETNAKIQNAIKIALELRDEKFSKAGPLDIRSPFRYGYEKTVLNAKGKLLGFGDEIGKFTPQPANYPQYEDKITMSLSSPNEQPGVVIPIRDKATGKWKTLEDKAKLYSGCYGIVTASYWALTDPTNRGISTNIINIMVMADGEPLRFSNKAAGDDFEDVPEYTGENAAMFEGAEPDMDDM